MKKIDLALISGGVSPERDVSIKSGEQVFQALDRTKYDIKRYDPKYDLQQLVADSSGIDFAFIILHGPFGEDGTIQGLLELLNIPYQGSGVLGSALSMHKLATKRVYEQSKLPTPAYRVVHKNESGAVENALDALNLPLVIKPVQGGSSIGMSIVKEKDALNKAMALAFDCDDAVLLESYVQGVELTVGVIGNDAPEALPVVEIVPGQSFDFFDYSAKYTPGATQEICPARISETVRQQAWSYAIEAHRALFCQDYSRTDMILNGNDLYLLETNTIPGMTPTSLLPLAAEAAGLSYSQLLDKLIHLGMERHEKAKGRAPSNA